MEDLLDQLAVTTDMAPADPQRLRAVRSFAIYILECESGSLAETNRRVPDYYPGRLGAQADALCEAAQFLRVANEENPLPEVDMTDPGELAETLRWKRRVQECSNPQGQE